MVLLVEGESKHQAPGWSFGVWLSQHRHTPTHTYTLARTRAHTDTHKHTQTQGGPISRLARGAVRQLLAFQKRLAPGSTVNNELILSLGPCATQHICFGHISLIQNLSYRLTEIYFPSLFYKIIKIFLTIESSLELSDNTMFVCGFVLNNILIETLL